MFKSNTLVSERELVNLRNQVAPILPMLENDLVTDIMANPNGSVYVHEGGETKKTEVMMSHDEMKMIIFLSASMAGEVVDEQNPDFEGALPLLGTQARISATMPPWTKKPSFCIRKFSNVSIPLESYFLSGRADNVQINQIKKAVFARQNILISGGTGSGKTTLVKAIISYILDKKPGSRLYIVEDTQEIHCTGDNTVSIRVNPEDSAKAVAKALRYFPERIIFGEVRYGRVLLELLKSWNTGHPGGITTIHANSAKSAYSRAENLLSEVVIDPYRRKNLINETIHVIIHLSRGGKIEKILEKK